MDKPQFTEINAKIHEVVMYKNKDGAMVIHFDPVQTRMENNDKFMKQLKIMEPQFENDYSEFTNNFMDTCWNLSHGQAEDIRKLGACKGIYNYQNYLKNWCDFAQMTLVKTCARMK